VKNVSQNFVRQAETKKREERVKIRELEKISP
jgi:hypothetical protein